MASSELNKRALYFFAFAGILILILIFFPLVEESIYAYIASQFGLIVAPDSSVSLEGGKRPDMMTETSISLILNILHIFKVMLWMLLVIAVVRFLSFLITKTIYRNTVQGELSSLLKTVVSIVIYIVSFFIIFQSQFPAVQLAPLFTGSTIIGIVVGLAVQDTLGNLFAGLALQADQSFLVGDVISISNRGSGVVESVSWRGIKIRTFQNKLLVISHAVLGKEMIEVAPKGNLNARLVNFSTVYTASPANTASLVREAMRQSENVSPKMRPVVRIRDYDQNGINWEVKYWPEEYSRYNDTDALIRERIWYAFKREKIDFPHATSILHLEEKVPEPDIQDTVDLVTERLKRVPIFDPLSDEEMTRLAKLCRARVYAPGESIVRLGGDGNSMFVINRGKVKVQVIESDQPRVVSELSENDFFGEMSLLTGQPRTASVIALVESEVLQIRKNSLKPILESNPLLVQAMTDIIDERKRMLESLGEEEIIDVQERKQGIVLSIRKFFGLRPHSDQEDH